ncbi:hypothetical protein [uncultured Clostridium sp.]|uniref:hypothetical protein n=1 Tax=uncultured Clostridium sp. TaxID=59620 RepID=UPI002632A37C|nr:hypothetical protein [uncultured Clostridium sp.]
MRQSRINKIKLIEDTFNVNYNLLSDSQKNSYRVKLSRILDPIMKQNIVNAVIQNHKLGKYKNAEKALKDSNLKSKQLKELCPQINFVKFREIFGFDLLTIEPRKRAPWYTKYRKIICKDILNHKVKSIRYLNEKADVYDLTIQDNHNFALACGIFVHNSKDMSDAICGSIFNASKHAEEFAFDYGETLDTITQVSGGDSFTTNQIQIDFENELKNLYNPLGKAQEAEEKSKVESKLQEKKKDEIKRTNLDFGMGPAEIYKPAYTSQGIIWW